MDQNWANFVVLKARQFGVFARLFGIWGRDVYNLSKNTKNNSQSMTPAPTNYNVFTVLCPLTGLKEKQKHSIIIIILTTV